MLIRLTSASNGRSRLLDANLIKYTSAGELNMQGAQAVQTTDIYTSTESNSAPIRVRETADELLSLIAQAEQKQAPTAALLSSGTSAAANVTQVFDSVPVFGKPFDRREATTSPYRTVICAMRKASARARLSDMPVPLANTLIIGPDLLKELADDESREELAHGHERGVCGRLYRELELGNLHAAYYALNLLGMRVEQGDPGVLRCTYREGV